MKYFICEECGLVYAEREWAKKCYAWCSIHHSCNLEIIKHAVDKKKLEDGSIKKILKESKVIAVVGLSAKEDRPSFLVAKYLKGQGYRIIPVNPNYNEILGEKCFSSLKEISEKIGVVDIFRRSEDVLPIVEDAVAVGAKVVWMQEGIVNKEAAKFAEAAGLKVIMDRCMMKEHKRTKETEDGIEWKL